MGAEDWGGVMLIITLSILSCPLPQVVTVEDSFFPTQEQQGKPCYNLIWEVGELNAALCLVCNSYF